MDMKLTYFDLKNLAEPSRWVLVHSDVSFDDHRVQFGDWPDVKATLPWGQLPVLNVDGKLLAQSVAVGDFLGRKYNLAGDNLFESAKCLEYVLHCQDAYTKWQPYYLEQDHSKRPDIGKNLKETVFARLMKNFNEALVNNDTGFLVGKRVSWADFWLATFTHIWETSLGDDFLKGCDAVKKHREMIRGLPKIKEWIAKQQHTELFGVTM